ncbi:hypothetical protein NEFER03_0170 [Nematocida sp. LUAm3]|nr:hypothetical protein NEFER03_0170 [Nematocida sp. LUAm3]KAI5173623.1 hypothetical protein NEFER02_0139 [Nematocida sp. LUAm2]KAI5176844.1 hypothetical protein NEFER01_0169 [Nematocida sp. LUAm1]
MKKETERGLSVTQAIFPMVGSIMGSGVLNLPQSVEKSGYYLSGALLLTVASMSSFTLYQLVYCASKLSTSSPSYFLVCKHASPVLGYLADFCIGLQGLGVCFSYFLILKEWILKLSGLYDLVTGNILYNFIFSIGLMVLPSFMAGQKDLKKLGFASILCTISVLYLSALVLLCASLSLLIKTPEGVKITEGLINSKTGADVFSNRYNTSPSELFAALSSYIFAMGCQQNMVSVFSMLEVPTVSKGTKVGIGGIAIASFVYFLVSNGGYFAGGLEQKTSILDVLENKNRAFYHKITSTIGPNFFYLITLAKIAMSTVLFAGFAIQSHPARDAIITFLKFGAKDTIQNNKRKTEILVIACICIGILFGSLSKIEYAFVMSLIGTTASCAITYILPCIAYLVFPKKNTLFTGITVSILLAAMAISSIGTYSVIREKYYSD